MEKSNFLIFLIVAVLCGFGMAGKVEASASDNVAGFAWSDTIGWVSFNSSNCDSNDDGLTDQGNFAQCSVGEPITDYGVNIESNGSLTGFAWSDSIGWIKFNPSGPYPQAPNYSAKMDLANPYKLTGWARACAGTEDGDCNSAARTDGWDGWIKLRQDSDGYGVYPYDTATVQPKLRGSAWGSDIIGYLSFNCIDGGSCGSVDYKVTTNFPFNQNPDNPTNLGFIDDYCNYGVGKGHIEFNWTHNDPDGDKQIEFKIEVGSITSGWVSQVVNDGDTGSWGTDITTSPSGLELAYNTFYNWQVKVKDEYGAESGYSQGTFSTPKHPYPYPNFTIDPPSPGVGAPIQLCTTNIAPCPARESVCYSGGGEIACHTANKDFLWTIPEIPANGSFDDPVGGPISYNPIIQFDALVNADITLEIDDTDIIFGTGNCASGSAGCCAKTKSASASGLPLPEWWEISPSF